ncbi:MAG: FAD-dependent thymidylate synthase [Bryobacteraceae bacterium]|nr:FAD-dependent thymidylate synthase [Bryobacteraceae bacterium]
MPDNPRRVLTVAPLPPEKIAYALARYSRSPDSIQDSLEWVRTHDSSKFLESFYFQYGHASIADLGHLVLCFEGISELAATEIEDEQLWDGQARSSRYQDFSKSGFITPPGLSPEQATVYRLAADDLLEAYRAIHGGMTAYLTEQLPRPGDMKPDAYSRNIIARAYDVARYCLFLGIPTGVGQVVSIRTLERQIRRMRASEYLELAELGLETALACTLPPACGLDDSSTEPLAPTLAKYTEPESHPPASRRDLATWAEQNLPPAERTATTKLVDLIAPADRVADIAATLLYPVTTRPFRELYNLVVTWSRTRQMEVIETALQSRTRRDELLREFRTATYAFDFVIDIGAWRDLHRHRRCQQFRQAFTADLGFATPDVLQVAGLESVYIEVLEKTAAAIQSLPKFASDYLIPFGMRSRFLFRMDFAEAEYIIRLRSGVKGHFSYREIAWEMKEELSRVEPELSFLLEATPPSVEDPLKR